MKAFHHFIIKRLIFSSSSFAFKSFLFIKKINVNELIQFVRLFILALINIDNFENELTLYTFQSLLSSSIYILQKDASRAQLQIETLL